MNNVGWYCPKCGKIYGPAMTECRMCNFFPQPPSRYTDADIERAVSAGLAVQIPTGCAPDPCTYASADERRDKTYSGTCYLDAGQMRALVRSVVGALEKTS